MERRREEIMDGENRILLVLTGGTICTVCEADVRRLDSDASALRLVQNFRHSDSMYAESVDFGSMEEIAKFHTLSENMTIGTWNRIIAYLAGVDFGRYLGVIGQPSVQCIPFCTAVLQKAGAGLFGGEPVTVG